MELNCSWSFYIWERNLTIVLSYADEVIEEGEEWVAVSYHRVYLYREGIGGERK